MNAENMNLEIRPASAQEAKEVAWIVLEALDIEEPASEEMIRLCSEAGTLYSWQNTLLADIDGKVAGGIIGYDGAAYAGMREATWPRFWQAEDPKTLEAVPQECHAGEFYLDSMAVLPQFRGLGLGKHLLRAATDVAIAKGYSYASLLASQDKPSLVAYYEKLGFRKEETITFFGHNYWRMRLQLK